MEIQLKLLEKTHFFWVISMRKILHIFMASLFTKDYIEMICSNFENEEHSFLVYGENFISYEKKSMIRYDNVIYVPQIDFFFNRNGVDLFLKQYTQIIVHGVFYYEIIDFFFKHREYIPLLTLYFWGGDKKPHKYWNEQQIKKYRWLIQNAAQIVTIIQEDAKSIVDEYAPKGKMKVATYGEVLSEESIELKLKNKNRKYPVNILVGHSATETNHHIKVFQIIKKFALYDILVHVPLAYGNKEYAQLVMEKGKKILGDKFVAYEELIEKECYEEFLRKMDVAIFDLERQQALGNIDFLLNSGCKVYLKEESILDRFYRNECKCVVYPTGDLEDLSFEEFIAFSETSARNNSVNIRSFFNTRKTAEEWKVIFEEESNEKNKT